MKIAVRVDSSYQIGSGHLMRCLTLAGRMRKKHRAEIYFICRDLSGNLAHLIQEAGYNLRTLPRHDISEDLSGYASWLTVSQTMDAEETGEILLNLGQIDILVVDSYALDSLWEKRMRSFAKEIFVIDDLANRMHDCDVLLDQNFYLDKEKRYEGLVPRTCRMLLGPSHALLREEFYEARRCMRKRTGALENLLIFYGGSDLTDETSKAIRAVLQVGLTDTKVHVVVGRANEHKKEIKELCGQCENFYCHEQVADMARLMNAADLMLGAGGTTTWERCFLGLPGIVTAVAENQIRICEDCAQAGLIEYMGFYDVVSHEKLAEKIQSITSDAMNKMSNRCLHIFTMKN